MKFKFLVFVALQFSYILQQIACEKVVNIPIAGIFKSGSDSANAFHYAIYQHNHQANRTFTITAETSFSKDLDSSTVRRKICEQVQNRSVVAIFGGNLWHTFRDIYDITSIIHLPYFTSESFPIETINYTIPHTDPRHRIQQEILKDEYEKGFLDRRKFNSGLNRKNITAYGSYSERKQRYNSALENLKSSYLIQLRPSIIEVVAHLLIRYNWTEFSFVCNTDDGLLRLQKLIEFIHEANQDYVEIYVDIRFIPDFSVSTRHLRDLDDFLELQEQKNILLDFDNEDNLVVFMQKAVQMGMNRREYHYIINTVGLNEMNLNNFLYSGVNLTGFRIVDPQFQEVQTFLRNWTTWNVDSSTFKKSSQNFKVALMLDAMKVFVDTIDSLLQHIPSRKRLLQYIREKPTSCLVPKDGSKNLYSYIDRKLKVSPNPVGKLFINTMHKRGIDKRVGLTGKLDFTISGTRVNTTIGILSLVENRGLEQVGKWQDHTGLHTFHNPGGKGLVTRNRTVRVVTILTEPFAHLKENTGNKSLKGNDRFEGYAIDVIEEVAKIAGFKYEIHTVRDKKFGSITEFQFENGTEIWDGMIGEILNGTADIAVAPLTISLARAKIVKFTEPFLTFGISIMIKKPGQTKPGIFSFLLPLSNAIWLCIMGACLIVSCSIYCIARISPFEWKINTNSNGNRTVEQDFTLFNSFWFAFAAFVQQGVDIAPKSPGSRILISTWWFFTLIMIAYYTANLAAFLTVTQIVTPINEWKDLLRYEESGIDFGPIKEGATFQFFLKTKLSPFNALGEYLRKNSEKMVDDVKEGIKKVRTSGGKYALILESPENEFNNNQEPCNTMMVGTPFGDKGYGIASHMEFSWNDAINSAVLDLHENEKLAQFYKTWWKDKGQCIDTSEESASKALALINVAGVFYILIAGLFVALITTVVEFYYSVRQNHNPLTNNFYEYLHQKATLTIHGSNMFYVTKKEMRRASEGGIHPTRNINLI